MSTEKERVWQLAEHLHSAAIHLLRRLRIQDLAAGIGPAKLSALSVLVFSGRPLSLAELAQAEQVKNPTMSRLVSAMERDGLVRTSVAKEDARAIQITASAKGRDLLLAGKQRRVTSLARALGGLSQSQISEMRKATDLLREVIRKM